MYDQKLAFLKRLLGDYKFSHNTKEAEFFCCFCDHHKKKLSVNVETDSWRCWICEKVGKNLSYLIKEVGTQQDLDTYIKQYKAANVKVTSTESKNEVFKLAFPEGFYPLIIYKDSLVGKKAYTYLTKVRRISEEDILFYKIGICLHGQYKDRIIFPSFDINGELNFFTARSIEDGSYYVPQVPKGYKNSIIINELYIDWKKPIVIVEGFIDALKTSGNAVPLFGSSFGKYSKLFEKIVKNQTTVFLALDADAQEKSKKIADMLMRYNVPVYSVDVFPFKDVGEMDKKDFTERLNLAKKEDKESLFRERLRAIH